MRQHQVSELGALVLEGAPVVVLLLDDDGRVEHINPFFERLSGWRLDEARGRDWFSTFLPERDRERMRALFRNAVRGVPTRGDINAIVTRSGEERAIEWNDVSLPERDGRTTGLLAIGVDVTARVQAEDALRASEERYRRLVEHAPVSVYVHDGHTILFANRAFAQVLGVATPAEVLGRTLMSIAHPGDHAALVARIAALREGREVNPVFEGRISRVDGGVLHAEVIATGCVFEGRPAIQVVLVDVTARNDAREELRANQRRLAEAQRLAKLGSWELDLRTSALSWSDEIFRIFEIDPVRFAASYEAFLDAIHPDDQDAVNTAYVRSVATREPYEITHRLRMADGRIKHVHERCETHYADDGTPLRSVGTVQDITRQRHAEASLRESEERFRAVFESSPTAIGLASHSDGRLVHVNRALTELLGFAREELVGKTTIELGIWASIEDRTRYFESLQRHGQVTSFEAVLRRKDGDLVTVLLSGSTVSLGGTLYSLVTTIDITARKQTENALQLLSTGMAHLSGEALFHEVASQVARLVGAEIGFVGRLLPQRPRIRTVGLSIDGKPMPPEDYDLAQTPCEVVIGTKASLVTQDIQRRFRADQRLAALGVSGYAAVPLFDPTGEPLGHVGVMSRRPLRHPEQVKALLLLFAVRTSAEIERQESAARFQDLFDFSPDAILMVNEEGQITMANRTAMSLFGYRHDELVGLPVEQLMPDPGRRGHVALRRDFLSATVPRQMGSRVARLFARHKDGSTFPVDISLSPMQSGDRRVVVAAVRDISERVRAEEERAKLESRLVDARKLEAIGTLAGGIAHDFNNLLAVVVANVELARGEIGHGQAAVESLDQIELAAARGAELVRQILAFSRKQSPNRVAVSLRAVIEETAKMLRVALPAGVELVVRADADASTVLADATQLRRVLMNLGTNACHALDGRPGRIIVALDEVVIGATAARAQAELRAGRYARITVSDTGTGIAAAALERIFEPFFTTKDVGKGSGLGLAVVHGIVQAHGGTITVESRLQEGTTFHIYLPAASSAAGAAPSDEAKPDDGGRPAGKVQHVLFLDDEPQLVEAARRLLEHRGYRITGFTRALEALEAVRSDPAGFDVVVTDFLMPDLSGLDVAREIARLRPDLPVVLVSGHLDEGVRAELSSAGVRQMIDKPCSASQLDDLLRKLTAPSSTDK